MKNRIGILAACMFMYLHVSHAQTTTTGCFYIHSTASCRYFSIVQTYDGNFVIGGLEYGLSGNSLNQNFWVIKIDGTGNLLWSSSIGGTAQDGCYRVIETSDHNLLAVGFTGGSGNQDILIVKYAEDGTILWSKNIDHPADLTGDNAYAYGVVETDDGYVITGTVASSLLPYYDDAYLVKIDFDGNKQWSTKFNDGSYGTEIPQKIIQAVEGGYTISGWTTNSNAFLTHVDESGNIQWSTSVTPGVGFDVIQTNESDYLLSGYRFDAGQPNGNAFVTKLDTAGNQIWSKTYGDAGIETFYGLYPTNDGGFIGAGTEDTTGFIGVSSQKGFVAKCNSNGELQWSKKIKYAYQIEDVIQLNDGGYILLGYNTIYRLDANGNTCAECEVENFGTAEDAGELSSYEMNNFAITGDPVFDSSYTEYSGGTPGNYCLEIVEGIENQNAQKFDLFPNPANETIYLNFNSDLLNAQVNFYSDAGIRVEPDGYQLNYFPGQVSFDISNFTPGIYLVTVNDGGEMMSDKFIVMHQ